MRPGHILAALAAALLLTAPITAARAGEVLDRIVERKTIRFGYRTDAPPFSFSADGRAQGFSTDLCGVMAGAIMVTSDLREITGTFRAVDTASRFDALTSGEIDVLCGATTATLMRRETMSFTIPIFATGVGTVVSADAPDLMQEVLIDGGPAALSGAAIREALGGKRLGVRASTTAEDWLRQSAIAKIEGVEIVAVDDHAEGLAGVAEGNLEAYFADRAILAGVLARAADADRFALSRNTFTFEPYALAIPRGDEELRLVLDRALSHVYRSGAIFSIFERHFGKAGANEILFYGITALPE